jgi:DNA-binding NarL/FixJ family response regulator
MEEHAGVADDKTRLAQAEARAEQAEARTEQAKTRTELAETRTEQAESRTELAKTRTEQAETRAEQTETILQRVVHNEVDLPREIPARLLPGRDLNRIDDQKNPLEQLTSRQREILLLIAEGQNTKQIAGLLKLSPKTVEYHRMRLMDGLDLHDVAGLVRFALRVGLLPQQS